MPMHRAPMMNSALGLRPFNRFNDGDFDRMIGFGASTVSIKSFLSATSAFHGGGVLGGVGTGATTHTDPTNILNILIRPTTRLRIRVMVTMAMVTYTATRLGVITAAITAARTTKMTMKVLCAMFSPNTQFLGTAMTRRRHSSLTENATT